MGSFSIDYYIEEHQKIVNEFELQLTTLFIQ